MQDRVDTSHLRSSDSEINAKEPLHYLSCIVAKKYLSKKRKWTVICLHESSTLEMDSISYLTIVTVKQSLFSTYWRFVLNTTTCKGHSLSWSLSLYPLFREFPRRHVFGRDSIFEIFAFAVSLCELLVLQLPQSISLSDRYSRTSKFTWVIGETNG